MSWSSFDDLLPKELGELLEAIAGRNDLFTLREQITATLARRRVQEARDAALAAEAACAKVDADAKEAREAWARADALAARAAQVTILVGEIAAKMDGECVSDLGYAKVRAVPDGWRLESWRHPSDCDPQPRVMFKDYGVFLNLEEVAARILRAWW